MISSRIKNRLKANDRLIFVAIIVCLLIAMGYSHLAPRSGTPRSSPGYPIVGEATRHETTDVSLGTLVVVYQLERPKDEMDNVLILVSLGPEPYGKDRGVEEFLQVIHSTGQPTPKLSLALLVVDLAEYASLDRAFSRYYTDADREHLQSVRLIHAPFLNAKTLDRENRHAVSVQKERRRTIARARNFLLYSSLRHQKYVLWLDADVSLLPKAILPTFISSNKDIITVRVTQENTPDYDLNAWVGDRAKPDAKELERMRTDPKFVYTPHNSPQTKNLRAFMKGKKQFVELDSVGGAVLFVKAEIHKQGVTHTPYYAIGTDFGLKEGYDGIETEGLCYVAKTLGYKCWGMPLVYAVHTH